MRYSGLVAFAFAAVLFSAPPEDLTKHVNIFIGTGGHGHTYPGATVPFGMVQLGPDTYNEGWDWCSGYHYSDSSIMGFSHTHLSGTGASDMLDVLLMPGTGPDQVEPGTREKPGSGYRSRFAHSDEVARPGYYSVLLKDYGIKAELTATDRAGIHKYTFPASDSSHFIVDFAHTILQAPGAKPRVLSAELNIVDDTTITGARRVGNWANGRHIYFAMKFSKPFVSPQLVNDGALLDGAMHRITGRYLKALVHFKTSKDEVIYVKVGISGVSIAGALKNLEKEIPDFDFAKVEAAAHDAWQRELNRVHAGFSNAKNTEIFYTALYHTMLAPTLFDDVDGQYRGMDLKVHQLPAGEHNYSTFSLWDTYRAEHPLFTLMERDRIPAMVNCLVRMGEESPAGAPVWPLQGAETGCMTGYHSAPVIAEAQAKGFTGVDYSRGYAWLRRRALEEDYRGLGYYRKLGYIPSDKEEESATKTLEYSYDDWAVAKIALALGKEDDAKVLLAQSQNYRNLWDASTGLMRPKLADGTFASPFDPRTTGVSKNWRDFTEANSWQATWQAQHDPQGYIELLGSREALVKKLDELFNQSSFIPGEVPVDMTGLVGQYSHGNEPDHHVAYLYDYAGAAWKTQSRVRDLMEHQYGNKPDDGVAGNEDCGQMSAWYVISALGFYAVDPVSGNFVFGSPLVDRATVELGAGKQLVVRVRRSSPADAYIQSVKLNGKPYDKVWFKYADVVNGGTLDFVMGSRPNEKFGAAKAAAPPSMSAAK